MFRPGRPDPLLLDEGSRRAARAPAHPRRGPPLRAAPPPRPPREGHDRERARRAARGSGPARKAALLRHFGSADRFLRPAARSWRRSRGCRRRWRATCTTACTRPPAPGGGRDPARRRRRPRRARDGADDHHRHERRREEPGDGHLRGRRLVLRRQPAARPAAGARRPGAAGGLAGGARGGGLRRPRRGLVQGARAGARAGAGASGVRPRVVFLEASDETLINRFRETRRPHPLSPGGSVAEGSSASAPSSADVRERADVVIDTTGLSIWDLRRRISEALMAARRPPRHARRVRLVRLQARRAARRRPALRRPLPAQPALRPRAAAADRARRARGRVRGGRARHGRSSGTRLEALLDFLLPAYARGGQDAAWWSGSAAPAGATAA